MKSLVLLVLIGLLTSCRSIERLTTRADSTAFRSVDTGEQWQREIIREYLPGPVRYDTVIRYDTLHVPQLVRVPAPYPVREIIREAAARQFSQQEQKQVQTATQQKDTQVPFLVQALMLLCGLAVFGAIGLAALSLLRK